MAPQKTSYGEFLLNNRLIVLVALLTLTLAGTFGAKNLYFDNDYRSFFGETNPQLEAFISVLAGLLAWQRLISRQY